MLKRKWKNPQLLKTLPGVRYNIKSWTLRGWPIYRGDCGQPGKDCSFRKGQVDSFEEKYLPLTKMLKWSNELQRGRNPAWLRARSLQPDLRERGSQKGNTQRVKILLHNWWYFHNKWNSSIQIHRESCLETEKAVEQKNDVIVNDVLDLWRQRQEEEKQRFGDHKQFQVLYTARG